MGKHEKQNIDSSNVIDDELVELEFDEESVSYYIVDENDNEIGVCLIENGEEVEYIYEDDDEQLEESSSPVTDKSQNIQGSLTQMKDELEDFKGDAQAAAKELKEVSEELQSTMQDLKDSLRIFPKKK